MFSASGVLPIANAELTLKVSKPTTINENIETTLYDFFMRAFFFQFDCLFTSSTLYFLLLTLLSLFRLPLHHPFLRPLRSMNFSNIVEIAWHSLALYWGTASLS